MPTIFISYRSNDSEAHATHLSEGLKRDYGRGRVFMSIDSIPGGTDWVKRIDSALDASDITVVLIGDDWVGKPNRRGAKRRIDRSDDWVRREVAESLRRDDVEVVPVLVEGASMPTRRNLPDDLSELPRIEYRELRNRQWPYDYGELRRTLDDLDRDGWWRRTWRRLRLAIREAPTAAKFVGVGAIVAAVIGAVLLINSGSGDGAPCGNRFINAGIRQDLATAAGEQHQAVAGSVFYGVCDNAGYATAKFPDGSHFVLRQQGRHSWMKLGPVSEATCRKIPAVIRREWTAKSGC